MKKVAIFTFNGNPMCMQHVLLNTLDMNTKGIHTEIIIEGEAVKLVEQLERSNNQLYQMAKEKAYIAGVCKACSAKFDVLAFNEKTGLTILGDMKGHPSFCSFLKNGYEIMTM
ncbi:MAG: hypothetical protein PWR12_399 [Eubacteriaceae bacterium]|jgi:ATP-dependent DNA ligase|nr:hypothetical protein [Eubacteriaceae bacterium]MDK2936044.1 hypothetical protein [Eubacteriaceae bacterium]